ncbi:MAG: iron-sulfur cluster-binding domain-containing protein [Bdellovibrionales bacterium]|nr:iron-sulfur cluster-binding domain-containing protein [Bdellovibrionales bacterium]
MGIEQYKALFVFTSGFSIFTIMLLSLRLISLSRKTEADELDEDERWTSTKELEIVEVISETHNIKSFKLKRVDGYAFPSFHCGQFISFQIDDNSSLTRSYSISSMEQNRHVVQVSVKQLTNGIGSTWFHQRREGDRVLAFPPSGHFFDLGDGEQERIFVAGGIGITPMLSILLTHLENGKKFKMSLFYGARTRQDLAFHGLLDYLAARHDHFNYFPILSNDNEWMGDTGYLNWNFIKNKKLKFENPLVYICGPDAMTEPLLKELDSEGFPELNIHIEKFVSPSALDESQIPERDLKVKWLGQTYEYHGRQDLLSFLESQNQSLPYACRSGVCGSCKCWIKGPYKMLTQAGLTRLEQKKGLALACVSFPEGDIEVQLEN